MIGNKDQEFRFIVGSKVRNIEGQRFIFKILNWVWQQAYSFVRRYNTLILPPSFAALKYRYDHILYLIWNITQWRIHMGVPGVRTPPPFCQNTLLKRIRNTRILRVESPPLEHVHQHSKYNNSIHKKSIIIKFIKKRKCTSISYVTFQCIVKSLMFYLLGSLVTIDNEIHCSILHLLNMNIIVQSKHNLQRIVLNTLPLK